MYEFRITYTYGHQRTQMTATVCAATSGEAAANFGRHNPRSKIIRVDPVGAAARAAMASEKAARARPVVELTPEDRPMTDEDRQKCIGGLRSLRERLRKVEVERQKAARLTPSIEQRDSQVGR